MKLLLTIALFFCICGAGFSDEKGFDRASDRLYSAERDGRWSEAIAASNVLIRKFRKEDYISVERRLADVGDFQLRLLDLRGAEATFKKVASRNDEYGQGALGLARICEQRGDYDGALNYLPGYAQAWGSGCGNCLEARAQSSHIFKTMWQHAKLPREKALSKLKVVAAGKFKPLPGDALLEKPNRKIAAREAQLVMAGIYRRSGQMAEARRLYDRLRKGDDDRAYIARAYYDQLSKQSKAPPKR